MQWDARGFSNRSSLDNERREIFNVTTNDDFRKDYLNIQTNLDKNTFIGFTKLVFESYNKFFIEYSVKHNLGTFLQMLFDEYDKNKKIQGIDLLDFIEYKLANTHPNTIYVKTRLFKYLKK